MDGRRTFQRRRATSQRAMVVVNDMAERGMALIQDFNTRIEKELGSVSVNPSRPHVVSEYRQQFLDCTKKIIVVASIATAQAAISDFVALMQLDCVTLHDVCVCHTVCEH